MRKTPGFEKSFEEHASPIFELFLRTDEFQTVQALKAAAVDNTSRVFDMS